MSDTHLNGKYIKNVQRIDEKTIVINLKNGNTVTLNAVMTDYEDCSLLIYR